MKIYCHVCKKEIESLAVSLHRDEVTFGEMMKLGIGTPPPRWSLDTGGGGGDGGRRILEIRRRGS